MITDNEPILKIRRQIMSKKAGAANKPGSGANPKSVAELDENQKKEVCVCVYTILIHHMFYDVEHMYTSLHVDTLHI